MEYINRILQDGSLSEKEVLEKITAKIQQINESILALLDHKVYDENTQVTEIVEKQLEKSKSLILQETCQECFIAVKYCTLQSLQEQLRRENQLIRREVEVNLSKEMNMALQRIKSICGTYFCWTFSFSISQVNRSIIKEVSSPGGNLGMHLHGTPYLDLKGVKRWIISLSLSREAPKIRNNKFDSFNVQTYGRRYLPIPETFEVDKNYLDNNKKILLLISE